MAWNDLTLSDKARMINLAVKSGIIDLRTIRDVYNTYATGGELQNAPEEPVDFTPTRLWAPKRDTSINIPFKAAKVSRDDLVNEYIDKVLWKMENPREKGLNRRDNKYYSYTDKDTSGNTHINIGPGLEKNGHPEIDYNRGHSRREVDTAARATVEKRVDSMLQSLQTMNNGKYAQARDTLSLGPLLSMLDIAYNGRTTGKRNLPEKWPTLVKNITEGDLEAAKRETYSGSKRRQKMRNDLLTYDAITRDTVRNR
jgi:hypothetical protein